VRRHALAYLGDPEHDVERQSDIRAMAPQQRDRPHSGKGYDAKYAGWWMVTLEYCRSVMSEQASLHPTTRRQAGSGLVWTTRHDHAGQRYPETDRGGPGGA
jgi:hypothetical protein